MEPMKPRITKSTATAAIKAMFPKTSDLLKRFNIAKDQANLWDGERDGLREVVKQLEAGQYDDVLLSKSTGAEVLYPNAEGKYQIECTLQTTLPAGVAEPGLQISVYAVGMLPEQFIHAILSELQHSKEQAIAFVKAAYIGQGEVVDNKTLYAKSGSEKATITIV